MFREVPCNCNALRAMWNHRGKLEGAWERAGQKLDVSSCIALVIIAISFNLHSQLFQTVAKRNEAGGI